MEEITLRNVQITYSGKTLTVSCDEHDEESVSLDPEQTVELVEYIRRLAPKQKLGRAEFNRRESFRVPLVFNHDLVVKVTCAGREYVSKPIDISMAGVQIELGSDCPMQLRLESQVVVYMELGEDNVQLDGVVRRVHEGKVGIFFPDCMKGGTMAPPHEMRLMVMDLQRSWMQYNREIDE